MHQDAFDLLEVIQVVQWIVAHEYEIGTLADVDRAELVQLAEALGRAARRTAQHFGPFQPGFLEQAQLFDQVQSRDGVGAVDGGRQQQDTGSVQGGE